MVSAVIIQRNFPHLRGSPVFSDKQAYNILADTRKPSHSSEIKIGLNLILLDES